MGLFAAPPPLRDHVQAAISPFLFADDVDRRYQQTGRTKIAKSQQALLAALRPGEKLVSVVPCFAGNTGYDGIAVATSDRTLHFKGNRIQKEISRLDLTDVSRLATRHGTFLLQFISRKAAPFKQFADGDLNDKSTMLFWEGTIQFCMVSERVMNDFVEKSGFLA